MNLKQPNPSKTGGETTGKLKSGTAWLAVPLLFYAKVF